MKYGFQLAHEYEPSIVPTRDAVIEVKYDGTMALCENGRLYNRRGVDISDRFPEITPPMDSVLVGEICIFMAGLSDFNLILRRTASRSVNSLLGKATPATFLVFDILEHEGRDLTSLPLRARLRILDGLNLGDRLKRVQHYPIEDLELVAAKARDLNEEGLILKRLDRPYVAAKKGSDKRPDHWVKLKFWETRAFEIERNELTPNRGFNLIIRNRGREQEVVCNDVGMQQRVLRGEARWVVVRYLEEGDEGALRQPHVRDVYANEPKDWGNGR